MGWFSAYGSSTPPPGVGGKGFFGASPPAPVVASGWTTLTTGFEASLDAFFEIFYLNGNWVITTTANGNRLTVVTSPDGVTWSQHLVSAASVATSRPGAAFGNGTYVVTGFQSGVGGQTRLYTSPDLASWTFRGNGGFVAGNNILDVVFGNGVFLLVSNFAPTGTRYATSPDGITWTQQSTYVPHQWGQPIFDGTRFLAPVVGSSSTNKIATSTDGINWTESSATLGIVPFVMANNGTSQYVVGDSTDDNGDSLNGALTIATALSFHDSGNPTQWIEFGGTRWERCNSNTATVQSSTDGLTWAQDTVPAAAAAINNIAFGAGEFIAVGGDQSGNNYAMTRAP